MSCAFYGFTLGTGLGSSPWASRRTSTFTYISIFRAWIISLLFSVLASGSELQASRAVYRRRHSSCSTTPSLLVRGTSFSFRLVFLFVFIGQWHSGLGASIQDKADDCMRSFGRSRPDFTHLQGSELTSSVNAVVNGLCGWTDDLHLGTVFVAVPHSLSLQRILRAALWQIIVPLPSEVFMSAMGLCSSS